MPLNEGQTVQYIVTTTNTADGTTLYWKTTGNTTNSDIVGGNTGSVTITNNQDSIIKTHHTSISLYKKIDTDRQKQLEYKDNIITNTQNQIKKLKLKFIVSSIALVGILLVI